MLPTNDATAAIESLEALLKAKIRLQDAQAESQAVLAIINLLFEPSPLDEEQKNLLRNGVKNLKKLLEAHTAYGETVQQAEPARTLLNQLFGSEQSQRQPANGKAESKAVTEDKADSQVGTATEDQADSQVGAATASNTDSKAEGKTGGKVDNKAEGKAEGKPTVLSK